MQVCLVTVCMHYVCVVRSTSGWWFGGLTVPRVEGRGWRDYVWLCASRISKIERIISTTCM